VTRDWGRRSADRVPCSVIIAAKNEASEIADCIANLDNVPAADLARVLGKVDAS